MTSLPPPPAKPKVTAWRPVVDGELAAEALEAAAELGRVVMESGLSSIAEGAVTSDDASLSKGWAGQAIALSYLGRAFPGEGFEDGANDLLEAAVPVVASHRMTVGLMQGFTGIAWAVAHLGWGGEDATGDIDDPLITILARPNWPGEYDLVSGLSGIGAYALQRVGSPRGEHMVELIIDRLIERAESTSEGIRWFTPPEFILASRLGRAPKGFYNLGMAHGLPAAIAFLADATSLGIALEKTRPVLEGAVAYLLHERLNLPNATWPFYIGEEIDVAPARLAWCYGDPGVLSALRRAVDVTGNPTWEEAMQTAIGKMLLRAPDGAGVAGASLCHGSAGLALMFARLALHLENDELAEHAANWVRVTLSMRDPAQPMGGFSVWDPFSDDEEGEVQGPGLLAGLAGVALALLVCASDAAPTWDRALMLSGPTE